MYFDLRPVDDVDELSKGGKTDLLKRSAALRVLRNDSRT